VADLAILSLLLWIQGYPEQARIRALEALSLAEGLGHPYSLGFAQQNTVLIFLLRREALAVQAQSEVLHSLAIGQGFPSLSAQANLGLGWALSLHDQAQGGISYLRESTAVHRESGMREALVTHLATLGEVYGRAGQPDPGLQVLGEALGLVDNMGGHWWEAELYRLKGELLQNAECGVERVEWTPEACFKKALEIARRQQAKSWELRAAMSLVRLWQSQGKTAEARQLLAPVYDWFTEGFDTADLQDARALLETL
jgi:predicted ATPase